MTVENLKLTLEAARKNAGYSQAEAAAKLGVHPQTLAAWERDSSKLSYIEANKLSKLYNISTDILFFGLKNEFIRSLRKRSS
ncbi:helix-turn-helix transcriptional regulator [Limosilactobacillus caecicola]|uniref:helix-turn-helix transcriptional regulator n=1 Tax=Limosilactobacillus caecicola TaxID=2941332 RepID=UPI00203D9FF6|nr:helix-turn-helix transcriptional regulator [Limosilactobacillus caecicola]